MYKFKLTLGDYDIYYCSNYKEIFETIKEYYEEFGEFNMNVKIEKMKI